MLKHTYCYEDRPHEMKFVSKKERERERERERDVKIYVDTERYRAACKV
jgi:hypothetical protein